MEPVKRQSTTRKKSSATEGVSTRPVSTAVSWVNTTRAPQHAGGVSKLTFSHPYLHICGSQSGPATSNISVTWDFVAPTLGRDGARLSTLSPATCPAQKPFPCSSKSEQAGLSGENFNPVVTFARCDLAENDGHWLSGQDGFGSRCLSHWPAVTEVSCSWLFLRKNLCQTGEHVRVV